METEGYPGEKIKTVISFKTFLACVILALMVCGVYILPFVRSFFTFEFFIVAGLVFLCVFTK